MTSESAVPSISHTPTPDASGLMQAIVDGDRRVRALSPSWQRYGISQGEQADVTLATLIDAADLTTVETSLSSLVAVGASTSFDARVVSPGAASSVWLRVFASRVDEAGEVQISAFDISDLKAENQRLATELEVLDQAIEHTPVGLAIIDEDGTYIRSNDWFRQNAGGNGTQVRGMNLFTSAPPEIQPKIRQALDASFASDSPTVSEWTTVLADGTPGALRSQAKRFTTSDGRRYLMSMNMDISEFRRRGARLSLFQRMLESTPMIIWATDKNGIFTMADGKGLELFNVKPNEWVGRDGLNDWKGTQASANMSRALSGEEFKASISHPGPLHLDVWYAPIRDVDGQIEGMIGLALDVTKDRQSEIEMRAKLETIEAQREKINLFDQALNTAPLVLWTVDLDGNYVLSEGKGLELIGFKGGEAVGLNVFDMFRGLPIENAIRRTLEGEEVSIVTEAAPGVFFDNWYLPLRKPETGEIYGAMGLAVDSSERLRGERELREKLDLIERQSATIRALATPIIRIWDEVLCLPVIGTVDSQRTADMMDSLLQSIVREQVRFTIVDLTGVEVVDTSTADHLIRLFKAAKVLGVDGVLCGIQPAVAQTVVALGMDLGEVRTMRTLQEALKWCIAARAKGMHGMSGGASGAPGSRGAPHRSAARPTRFNNAD